MASNSPMVSARSRKTSAPLMRSPRMTFELDLENEEPRILRVSEEKLSEVVDQNREIPRSPVIKRTLSRSSNNNDNEHENIYYFTSHPEDKFSDYEDIWADNNTTPRRKKMQTTPDLLQEVVKPQLTEGMQTNHYGLKYWKEC